MLSRKAEETREFEVGEAISVSTVTVFTCAVTCDYKYEGKQDSLLKTVSMSVILSVKCETHIQHKTTDQQQSFRPSCLNNYYTCLRTQKNETNSSLLRFIWGFRLLSFWGS